MRNCRCAVLVYGFFVLGYFDLLRIGTCSHYSMLVVERLLIASWANCVELLVKMYMILNLVIVDGVK